MRWSCQLSFFLLVFETGNNNHLLETYYFNAKLSKPKEVSFHNCQQRCLPLAILSEFESRRLEKFYSWLEGSWCVTSGTSARDLWKGAEMLKGAEGPKTGKCSSRFQKSTMFSSEGQSRVKTGHSQAKLPGNQDNCFWRLVGDVKKMCSCVSNLWSIWHMHSNTGVTAWHCRWQWSANVSKRVNTLGSRK